ncbi:hypothetical protein ACP70R_003508 [Stipagrostis hirtigluma subsp. patula]
MNKSALFVLAACLAAALLFVFAAGDHVACPGVPTESVDAACHGASTSSAMYDLCMRVLSTSPPTAEITAYAFVAAATAAESFASTVVAGDQMSRNGSLTGDLSDAWDKYCRGKYDMAYGVTGGAMAQLRRCDFLDLRQEYMDAIVAIEECTAKLLPAGGISTPLYGMVVGDRDRAVLAFRLALPLIPPAS